jgi:hypothetical protein
MWLNLAPVLSSMAAAARCQVEPLPPLPMRKSPFFAAAMNSSDRVPRRVGAHGDGGRVVVQAGDRREVLVGDLGVADVRLGHQVGGQQHHLVAVGLAVEDVGPADGATRARLVHHDEALRQVLDRGLREGAAEHVGAAAGRVGHHQLDRLVRERLAECRRGQCRGAGQAGEQAEGGC